MTTDDGASISAATGAVSISGTSRVGETLTADTSGIADDDGLTGVSYCILCGHSGHCIQTRK